MVLIWPFILLTVRSLNDEIVLSDLPIFPIIGVELICVEPIREFELYLTQTLRENTHVKCRELLVGGAENISGRTTTTIRSSTLCFSVIRDNQVDAVVSTLTLSSCNDVHQALREIGRILKPVNTSAGILRSLYLVFVSVGWCVSLHGEYPFTESVPCLSSMSLFANL